MVGAGVEGEGMDAWGNMDVDVDVDIELLRKVSSRHVCLPFLFFCEASPIAHGISRIAMAMLCYKG